MLKIFPTNSHQGMIQSWYLHEGIWESAGLPQIQASSGVWGISGEVRNPMAGDTGPMEDLSPSGAAAGEYQMSLDTSNGKLNWVFSVCKEAQGTLVSSSCKVQR